MVTSVITGITTPVTLAGGVTLQRHIVSSVICRVTSVEQVEANVKAADWQLTEEELGEVTTILDVQRLDWATQNSVSISLSRPRAWLLYTETRVEQYISQLLH